MRRIGAFAGWMFLAVVLGVAVHGQTLCSYRLPVSSIETAGLSFAYRYFNDAATPEVDQNHGSIIGDYARVYDAESIGYSASLNTLVALVDWKPAQWQVRGAVAYRYYISSERPLFGYGAIWGESDTGLPSPGLELRGGIGYGRFHDVTPLAQAHRLSALLMSLGSIAKPLPSRVLQQVADAIAEDDEESSADDVIAAIESLIEGETGGSLDAKALLSIEEEILLPSAIGQRFCGVVVQLGAGQELLDVLGGPKDFLYVMSADMAYPPTPLSQLRARFSFSSSVESFLADNKTLLEASYVAEIHELASFGARFETQAVHTSGAPTVRTHSGTASLSLGRGGATLVASLGVSRTSGDSAWTVDLSVSIAMDIL